MAAACIYPWANLTKRGASVTIRSKNLRSARQAANAYAARHGFAVSVWRKGRSLIVERVRA